jgi:anti-anti-sigma factor
VEIAESKDGEVHVLAPKGSLNTQTSPKLEQKLNGLLGAKARLIVIDFKGVDYLSSAALRVLLMITRRLLRAHGRLVLCAMSEDLKKVFSISGFDKDFTILPSRGEAVELAASTPPPPAGAEVEAKGKKAAKAPAKAEPAPAEAPKPAGGAPGWPFLQAAPKAAAPAEPAPAEAPPPPPPAAPEPAPASRAATILAAGDDSAPWAAWPASPAAETLAPRVARILATGL